MMQRSDAATTGPLYRRYVLSILTLAYTLTFLDRGLISILLQPIKEDLRLTDTQLGFLTGMAFALFYATLGLPVARLADRSNRASIISLAIGSWGLVLACCMFITSFTQLVASRIAASIGESGVMPPAYSLLGDYFPASAERARAMSTFMLAIPVASLVSFVLGGWLNDHWGWRWSLFVMGLPGFATALLIRYTVKEPRAAIDRCKQVLHRSKETSLRELLVVFWQRRSIRHLTLALIVLYTMGFGLSPWYAAFMIRSHHMSTAEVGLWLGVIFGICGLAGTWLGGYVISRWFGGSAQSQMRVSALAIAVVAPLYVLFLLVPGKREALAMLIPLIIAGSFIFGPTFALLQEIVDETVRATALAVVMLLANLIGMGLGPQIVGLLSDYFEPIYGQQALRYAMTVISLLSLVSAYHLWRGSQAVIADVRKMKECRTTG
jgi:MFS family permease